MPLMVSARLCPKVIQYIIRGNTIIVARTLQVYISPKRLQGYSFTIDTLYSLECRWGHWEGGHHEGYPVIILVILNVQCYVTSQQRTSDKYKDASKKQRRKAYSRTYNTNYCTCLHLPIIHWNKTVNALTNITIMSKPNDARKQSITT